MKAEFGRGTAVSDKKSEELFHVNNCGYYRNLDFDINVRRPHGRNDYQLIQIIDGCMYFYLNGNEVQLFSGSLILYRPHEPQIYRTLKQDCVSYNWIHFSGTTASDILHALKLDKSVYTSENSFSSLFINIAHECSASVPNEILISSMAVTILSLISKKQSSLFRTVTEKMKSDNKCTINQLAELSGLSVYHFIRKFKQEFGITPHTYMMNEKIEKSKYLLSDTLLSITEIAQMNGFDDPLYFSRVFKRKVGLSPKQYRESLFL